ncbi:MAG: glycoside hydrolase [Actinomycetota bacterium]|nr:glycoside hydrolase [Actinomycetota bacterium]
MGPRSVGDFSQPPETNDPYIYVDPGTGRVFTFHMSPILTCSISSFSDNGGQSWQTNPVGCGPTAVWDHQTMVAAKPRQFDTIGYPNVLHQCVNAVYAAMCSRSIDGGVTWQPSVPAYDNPHLTSLCGAQHGHLAAGPDGTVYLPTSRCGTRPEIFISRDDGLTWQQSVVSNINIPFVDPTVSADSEGNLYVSFIDESGWLYYSVSRNGGGSWSEPVRIAEGWTTQMPVIVAGDPGKVVVAYPATDDLPEGFATTGYGSSSTGVAWGANFSVSYNGLDENPTFETVVATGDDPIGRRNVCGRGTRCNILIDFIEAVIGPDGYPYASFVDGCLGACVTNQSSGNKSGTGVGLMTTLVSGTPLCEETCWRYRPSGPVASAFGAEDRQDALTVASAIEASRGLALDTPELRRLRAQADRRRVKAVLGS